MIAVAGFNTSIDKLLVVDDLQPGAVLRAKAAEAWPGGKGVHVALAAATLGEDVRLAGLVDEAQRALFESWLAARGVRVHAIRYGGPVRTCLTIHDRGGRTTEIREPGPAIEGTVWRTAAAEFVQLCGAAPIAVLSGSVPPGVPASAYGELVRDVAPRPVLVDAAGDLLRLAIDAHPFAVKPNREEAEALTGTTLDSAAAAARAARTIASTGVPLVIISRGAEGAVACWRGRVYRIGVPAVAAANAVGAGDCLIAGVAVGLARGDDMEDVLRFAVACGTAKVLSPEIGILRRRDFEGVLPQVWIEPLE